MHWLTQCSRCSKGVLPFYYCLSPAVESAASMSKVAGVIATLQKNQDKTSTRQLKVGSSCAEHERKWDGSHSEQCWDRGEVKIDKVSLVSDDQQKRSKLSKYMYLTKNRLRLSVYQGKYLPYSRWCHALPRRCLGNKSVKELYTISCDLDSVFQIRTWQEFQFIKKDPFMQQIQN